MNEHSTRAHMRLAASAADRWTACPASVRRAAELPESPSGPAAEWGTRAHEWLEWALLGGKTTIKPLIGNRRDTLNPAEPALCSEMAECVDVVLDYVWTRAEAPDFVELAAERRYPVPLIHAECGGTCDVTLLFADRIEVVDLKTGFKIVEPGSRQLVVYGAGALAHYQAEGFEPSAVVTTVIQPRAPHPAGPIRVLERDAFEFAEAVAELAIAAMETDDPTAKACAGEHCTFCPVAYFQKCPDLDAKAHAAAADAYGQPVNPTTLTPAQLGQRLRDAAILELWLSQLSAFAEAEAKAGRMPAGFKWVLGRGSREWKQSEAETLKILQSTGNGVDFAPRKMLSVAQAEKALGEKKFAALAKDKNLVETKKGKPQLAYAEDPRPAVDPAATSAFDAVTV